MELSARYVSLDEVHRALGQAAEDVGGEVVRYGQSVQGRALVALKIPWLRPRAAPRHRVLVAANIHGVEVITTAVALGVIDAVRRQDAAAVALRRCAEIWVIPSINPDGYARTLTQEGHGSLAELRRNARGVDLNRNWPKPGPLPRWALALGGWGTGSADPDNAFYRGSGALSEPETGALDALLGEQRFVASANLHSTMGTLFSAHVERRDHLRGYRRLSRALRGAQTAPYTWLASRYLDWFTGEMEDHQHHHHRCWAICVECFAWPANRARAGDQSLGWRFNPSHPQAWIDNDVPAILAYLREATTMGPPA